MSPVSATVPMLPAPGASTSEGAKLGYFQSGGGYPVQVRPEHVEALKALGWADCTSAPAITSAPNPGMAPPSHRPLVQPRLLVRMLPPQAPPGSAFHKMLVEGRLYEVPEGQNYLDVPIEDARVLASNGWFDLGPVGPTEARPANRLRGYMFTDTSIGLVLLFDGRVWRDFLTGESF